MTALGIFARTFERETLEEVLDAVEVSGFRRVQFNMRCAGLSALPDAIPDGLPEAVGATFGARGLAMDAVSATYNMAHPSRAVRDAGLDGLARIAAAAPKMGTDLLTLCTGSRHPDDMWRWHPANAEPSAWRDMRESVVRALERTQEAGVRLGVEPEGANVVSDARRARRLLDEVGDPRLVIVLDWANLVSPGADQNARRVLAEATELLADRLALVHVKDVTADGRPAAPGVGILPLDLYLAAVAEAGFDGPLIIHGVEAAEAAETRKTVELSLARARTSAVPPR